MKKKIFRFVLVTLFLLIIPVSVLAHPGRTDSSGGHYNRSTGKYHYHHGYPEHQHPNGVCPYEKKTSSDTTTKTTTKATNEATNEASPSRSAEDVPIKKMPTSEQSTKIPYDTFCLIIIVAVLIAIFLGICIYYYLTPSSGKSKGQSPGPDPANVPSDVQPPECEDDLLVIYDFFGEVLREPNDSYKREFVLYLARMSPDGWKRLEQSEKERDDQQC